MENNKKINLLSLFAVFAVLLALNITAYAQSEAMNKQDQNEATSSVSAPKEQGQGNKFVEKPIIITDEDLQKEGQKPADEKSSAGVKTDLKSADPIQITANVNRQAITIGDAIDFTISVEWDKGIEVLKVDPSPQLGYFEIQEIKPSKETKISSERTKKEYSFTLSTFETGDYEIPPFIITYRTKDKTEKQALSQPVKIHVKSVAGTADAKTDVRDIKSPAKMPPPPYFKYALYGIVALLIIGIPLALYIRRRMLSKKGILKEEKPSLPPNVVALEALSRLEAAADEMLDKGEFKAFYSVLTEIIRIFLGDIYRIKAIDLTTHEIMTALPEFISDKALLDEIGVLLYEADMVKFAKFIPSKESAKIMLEKARIIINSASPFPPESKGQKGEMASSPFPQEAAPPPSFSLGEKTQDDESAQKNNSPENVDKSEEEK